MSKDDNGNDDNNKVVQLKDRVKPLQTTKEQSNGVFDDIESIDRGVAEFNSIAPDSKGFFSIHFDKDNAVSILHAGELDLLQTIGILEYFKNELLENDRQMALLTEAGFEL